MFRLRAQLKMHQAQRNPERCRGDGTSVFPRSRRVSRSGCARRREWCPGAGCRSGATTRAKSMTCGYLEFLFCTSQCASVRHRISIYEMRPSKPRRRVKESQSSLCRTIGGAPAQTRGLGRRSPLSFGRTIGNRCTPVYSVEQKRCEDSELKRWRQQAKSMRRPPPPLFERGEAFRYRTRLDGRYFKLNPDALDRSTTRESRDKRPLAEPNSKLIGSLLIPHRSRGVVCV